MVSQILNHLFIPIIFLSFLFPAVTPDLASDRAALLRLSSAVGGRTRLWNLSNPSPCSWKGVYCDFNANPAGGITQLRLPGSGLSGEIPFESIGNMTDLRYISLRKNSLSGSIPSDLSSCTQLQNLYLQENNFSGSIPATLFALTNLVQLNLAGNSFSGEISPKFNNLLLLRSLHLENNNLSGSIPEMNNLSGLQELNVSNNQLNGSIPSILNKFSTDSFLGNTLCGPPLAACPSKGGKKLSAGAIAGIVIGSVIGLICLLVILFFLLRKRRAQTTPRQVEMYQSTEKPQDSEKSQVSEKPQVSDYDSPKPLLVGENKEVGGLKNGGPVIVDVAQSGGDDGLVFFGDGNVVFGLEELLRAPAEVVGKGTIGSTYKVYLEGETEVVVVKRLRNVSVSEKEFREKVEDLGMLVHGNLMPLRAYYYGREEKLIVFDCMPMGSLSSLLHGNIGAVLTWEIRTKIALGAAQGIDYLHSIGSGISHGNIKSSNILLTDYYGVALVSEHGLSQLVSPISTLHQNGYCAPEVTDSRKISQKADVYSFGVLLLELLTGKAPTQGVPHEEGVDLPRWVRSVSKEDQMIFVFDKELLRHEYVEEQMVQLLLVGIHCTSQHPDKRPSMVEVTQHIRELVVI